MFRLGLLLLIFSLGLMAGCDSQPKNLMKDGYYTAEAAEFNSQGWKEFLTINVSAGRIVSAEFNSKNASGFLRSWDMADKRRSNMDTGTNQSRYARLYTADLLNRQDPAMVGPIPGAVRAHQNFQLLAEAAVAQSKTGRQKVVFVKLQDQD